MKLTQLQFQPTTSSCRLSLKQSHTAHWTGVTQHLTQERPPAAIREPGDTRKQEFYLAGVTEYRSLSTSSGRAGFPCITCPAQRLRESGTTSRTGPP